MRKAPEVYGVLVEEIEEEEEEREKRRKSREERRKRRLKEEGAEVIPLDETFEDVEDADISNYDLDGHPLPMLKNRRHAFDFGFLTFYLVL
jgi:hypothetical protein